MAFHDLWCHVGDGPKTSEGALAVKHFGKPEIRDLELSIMYEYVLGLEIPMDDHLGVQFLNDTTSTAMPFKICLKIKIAYFSVILPLRSM